MIELKETSTKEIACPKCHKVWKYADSDLVRIQGKGEGFECPSCQAEVIVQEHLTDGYTYPIDFYDFSDGVEISNSEINLWIKKCVEYLRNPKYSNDWYEIGSGNASVFGGRTEDNTILIRVAKNYAEVEIE